MVTWLTKSTVTKYSLQTHVPDFKHKVFSHQNNYKIQRMAKMFYYWAHKNQKAYTEPCISAKNHNDGNWVNKINFKQAS